MKAEEADETKEKKTAAVVRRKKKEKKIVAVGRAYINATYNNTIITLTDQEGNALGWASAGGCGFKGAKKATPYAAQVIVKKAVDKVKELGLREITVFVRGVGTGRESAVRALNANGLNILSIKDITPIPHNGCRPRKPRRV
ncbi:MAG: 30S ribosomal protein S11 [Patescibacteria group bacterium]